MSPADAGADCEARKAELECQLELARLARKDQEEAEEKQRLWQEHKEKEKREQDERIAHEATVREWRQEEAKQRQERREAWRRFWETRRQARQKRQEEEGGQSGTLRVLLAFGIPAMAALAIYARSQGPSGKIFAVGLLTAVSAFAVGALLGFVFGIPRSIAAKPDPAAGKKGATGAPASAASADAAAAVAAEQRFAPNTNLEEISDWLTKILVGIGLVQIHKVSGAIEDLANGLAPSLGEGSTGFAVAVTLMISFAITGFVSAYLFTRLRLQGAFERALYRRVVEKLNTATDAMALVQKQLSPGDVDRPPPHELAAALAAATPGTRSQAFYTARDQRRKNWRGRSSAGEDKDYVAPTIEVFKALIACDPEGHYHRSRAELGFALKDQKTPDWAAARAALSEAIELRPEIAAAQFGMYEFNRAYCNIRLDLAASPSGASRAAPEIVSDLKAALGSADAREIVEAEASGKRANGKAVEDLSVSTWLRHNKDQPGVEDLL